jgi:purine nucleoside phosphorylase
MVKLGLIGGSGAKEVVEALGGNTGVKRSLFMATQWGMGYTQGTTLGPEPLIGRESFVDYFHFDQGDTEVYFILRHGKAHEYLPAELDQRGSITFLKQRGVDAVLLASATGSLDTSINLIDEGGIVVPSGIFRGFGYKGLSFGGRNAGEHAVAERPFSDNMRSLLLDSISGVPGATSFDGGLYIQNEGNQFESAAEVIDLYMRLDAPARELRNMEIAEKLGKEREMYERFREHLSVKHAQLGMTAVREVTLALEAGFSNLGLVCFPVNYGTGLIPAEQVDHKRTIEAIAKSKEPTIVPFLRNVIEKASDYINEFA